MFLKLLVAFATSAGAADFVPGEILVRLKSDSLSHVTAAETFATLGLKLNPRRKVGTSAVGLYTLPEGYSVDAVVAKLKNHPLVLYAQPNYTFTLLESPKRQICSANMHPLATRPPIQGRPAEVTPPIPDPDMSQAYHLRITKAVQGWNNTKGRGETLVAVIDSGIDYNHPDLAFNLWRNPSPGPEQDLVGYDFLGKNGLPYDDDEIKGHGTHASGIIGAVGGNGIGTSGVSQRVSIMALKGFSAHGYSSTEVLVSAIGYAVDHGARIISNSWANARKDNPAMIEAIEKARAKGVLMVFAAGNSHNDDDNDDTAEYPAGYHIDNILAVAATDADDRLASFSNYGKTTVMLGAPGVNIYSTMPGGKFGWESGTSMACPLVAGAAALVWGQNPALNYLEVKKILMDSVDPLPDLAGKVLTGGRLNVEKALSLLTHEN